MNQLLQDFVTKQKFTNVTQIDDTTFGCDGFHIDVEDIYFDMENEIAPGLIKLYYADKRTKNYRQWLADSL